MSANVPADAAKTVIVGENGQGPYTNSVAARGHALIADEPADLGGADLGPSPYEYVLAALGACTSMTLRMYANQKKWDVRDIAVRLTHHKEVLADQSKKDVITRQISFSGHLDDAQKARLMEIADKCPVHKTLSGGVQIKSVFGG